jgi:hypothetical protein
VHQGLRWISELLHTHNVPYVVVGGLAAYAYGSDREVADIDIDLPERYLRELFPKVREFVTFGPGRYRDENFDIELMTLDYHGQLIDLTGAESVRLFDTGAQRWCDLPTDLAAFEMHSLWGIEVPVITKARLCEYKLLLNREVDKLDVRAIQA